MNRKRNYLWLLAAVVLAWLAIRACDSTHDNNARARNQPQANTLR